MTILRLIFSLVLVLSSIFSLGHTTHATGLYEVVQGGSITIHWDVTGTVSCLGDFPDPTKTYPVNPSETGSPTPLGTGGISGFWLTNHSGTGSETFNNVLAAPKDYIFRCTGGGVSDTTTLRVTAPPLPSCSGETRGHCVLPNNTPSGSRVAGSCESGYVGSCSYTCSSGTWGDPHDNSCTPPNAAPNAPTITGPTTREVGQSGSYGFTSTDPEGDTLHYEIDWDNNGSVDITLPTGYVPSGTPRSQANDWASPQTATFKARAVDNGGHASGWSSYTVTISCPGGTTWDGSACLANVVLGDFWDGPALSRAETKLKMASRDIAFGLGRELAYAFGANVQLNWDPVTGGGTIICNITNNKGRADIPASPAGGNAPTGPLNTATTYRYTLTCGNGVGPDQSKWVDVQIFPLPTATLTATPSAIIRGQSSLLKWSSTDADSCTAVGGFDTAGAKSNAVGVSVSPPSTAIYQIYCDGPGGRSTPASVTIDVTVPTATISADPARVVAGGDSVITWDSTDVTNCNVTGPGGFSYLNNKKDTKTANNITTQSVYKISCTTAGSPVTASAIVNVVPDFTEF